MSKNIFPLRKVNEVCKVVRGGSPRPAGDQRFFGGSYIPWLTVAALTNVSDSNLTITSALGFLTEEGSKRSRRLSTGTVIISNSGATLGVAKILGFDCCANDGIAALDGVSGVSPEYFCYWLNTQTEVLRTRTATGNGQPNLNTTMISNLSFPCPPVHEQKAIAAALSDADGVVAGLERVIAKKRLIKQGAMQDLLTARRRLPGFSKEWEVKTLGDVARVTTGGRNNQDKDPMGEYPFFVRSDTVEKIRSYSYDCEAILVPGEGRIGEIFHYTNGRFDVHQRVYCISSFSEEISGRFIYFVLRQFFGVHAMINTVKATVDSLRRPTFTGFEFKFPPALDEQTAIAAILSDMDAEIQTLESRLTKARAVKEGMMQNLLTGRVRLV